MKQSLRETLPSIKSWIVTKKRNVVSKESSGLHDSLRYTMFLSRMFGVFPVTGLMDTGGKKLKFTLRSPYCIYLGMTLSGQVLMTVTCVHRMVQKSINLSNFSNLLFSSSGLLTTLLLIRLGRAWPKLVRRAQSLEEALPPGVGNIAALCNFTSSTVLLLGVVEHLLSVLYGIKVAHTCNTHGDLLTAYFKNSAPWIFDYVTFVPWKGFMIVIFNFQTTFLWTFVDVLIMVFSLYLTSHFVLLNHELNNNKDNMFWGEARMRYSRLARLVKLVDRRISALVLFSFAINLFFICMQLFNTLNKDYSGHFTACNNAGLNHGTEHNVYFTFSFTFLLIRTLLVSLLAARLHSASRAPALPLYTVPTNAYTLEVQRFLDQVNFTTVALSGLEFFHVTRGMILTVVGTIVTYELVLLQFSSGSSSLPINDT